jgi:hypothetical protein
VRIRTIKPEFWRSDDITALSREQRLLFIGLWSYVDDNGVGIDDPRRIAADLFALEDDQKDARDFVRDGLATFSRVLHPEQTTPLVERYEVDGKRYFYVTGWERHQRIDKPGKPRYPLPVDAVTSDDGPDGGPDGGLFATPTRESRESLAPGTGEQGNRGTGEQGTDTPAADASGTGAKPKAPRKPKARSDADPPGFPEFWQTYPRKVDKGNARTAFVKALARSGLDAETMTNRVAVWAAHWQRTGTQENYIPYAATWLNGSRYEDPPPTYLPAVRAAGGPATTGGYRGVGPSGKVSPTTQRIADLEALKEKYR